LQEGNDPPSERVENPYIALNTITVDQNEIFGLQSKATDLDMPWRRFAITKKIREPPTLTQNKKPKQNNTKKTKRFEGRAL
jgi:hypothetical protein